MSLKKRDISLYIRRVIESYLKNRWIIDDNGNGHQMTAGVPQGSVLGPTLWNVAYDDVLKLRLPEGATTIAYADDLALIVKADTIEEVEEIAQEALEIIVEWMTSVKLKIAPEKTEAVMLVKRRKDKNPNISILQHHVNISRSVKYLGVHLQRGLTGAHHIREATIKATKAATDIAKILPRTYGATEHQRRVLSAVAESICLYAAPIWSEHALKLQRNRNALEKVQRIMAIRITRAYRSTSTLALFVLARTTPWPLLALQRTKLYNRHVPEKHDDNEGEQTIEEMNAATMAEWQRRWDTGPTGRHTHACIPNIKQWYERKFGELTYYTTQVLTNHGNFNQYLHRMNLKPAVTCDLCQTGSVDDAQHTIMECMELRQARGDLTATSIPEMVRQMMTSEKTWDRTTRRIACIMKKKEALQSAGRQASRTSPAS